MVTAAPREDWPRTVAEFQEWHARRPERWEFIDGWPRMMAPASMKHSVMKANAFAAFRSALGGGPCRVLVDGPQIVTDEISAIPDVVVTCIPLDLSTPVIAEPVIIVEVMSPSTEADDAGRKWQCWQKIPTLRHYLVLSQDKRLVEIHSRAGELWRERFIETGAVELDDPPIRLGLDALYEGADIAA